MLLKSTDIADRLERKTNFKDPLIITPRPDMEVLRSGSGASVDLRLGSWFLSFKQSSLTSLDLINSEDIKSESHSMREHYIPFGDHFSLHPGSFILGTTLEWIRLPETLGAYVVGKSSWGRRGLIIATATGVHPRFAGCLTLELTNLGEIPIQIYPGMLLCQLFIHQTTVDQSSYESKFSGRRKPAVGVIDKDRLFAKLITN
ncbi:hypothetical protein BH09SUM1_BH09SUM1_09040 [soil metagenome]